MINLSCAELMSYNKTYNYWGDVFNYNSLSSYSIRGRVSGDPIVSGIRYAWSGMEALVTGSLGYQGFIINGVNFGTGKVTSLNFEEGNDIQSKKYSMSFEIFETGNLYNLTGTSYSEISTGIFNSNFPYFNNLQETLGISIGENNVQEFSQEMSFEIDDPVTFKNDARDLIFSGFSHRRMPNLGMVYAFPNIITGNSNSGYITYYNESYGSNSRYSFQKRSLYQNDNKAIWEYAHTFDYDGSDIVVSENGTINSIYFNTTGAHRNLSGARDRWATISGNIFTRVSGLFAAMANTTGVLSGVSNCPLINFPIDRRWQEDPLAGTIEYSYSFSNNPIYSTSGYIYSNSRQISTDQDNYTVVVENGEYQGVSPNRDTRFLQASGGYYNGRSAVGSRITGSFLLATGLNKSGCVGTGASFLTSDSVTFEEYEGKISYTNTYSSNPSYYTGISNFIKCINTISDDRPVHLNNKFLVPFVGEIAQSAEQSTEGSYTNSIQLFGKTGVSLSDYLTETFSKVVKPSGSGIFLKSFNYSFDPFNNVLQSNFGYSYSRYRSRNNILV